MLYAYIRVSHHESAKSGLSVKAQKAAILKYCRYHNLGEPEFFVDLAKSAWKIPFYKRPQGGELRKLLKSGANVVFYRLDRGFRSVLDFSRTVPYWINEGVSVHFVDQQFDMTSANGKLWANIMSCYAQWKSDIISERTKIGMARAKARKSGAPAERWVASKAIRRPKEQTAQIEHSADSPRVFSYARVSHTDSLKGVSLDAQLQHINRYIQEWMPEGQERGEHFADEAVSAFLNPIFERPAGSKLNEALRPGDHVVFARLDRVWRSTLDMAQTWDDWKRRGISLHFADTRMDTSKASGEAFMELLAVFAKLESADTSERIKSALAEAAAEGRAINQHAPLGFKAVSYQGKKWFAPDVQEIRDLFHMYVMQQHGMSLREISDQMELLQARRENRRPLPLHGVDAGSAHRFLMTTRDQRVDKDKRKITRTNLLVRHWSIDRVKRHRKAWPEVREIVKGLSDEVVQPSCSG